MRLDDQEDMAPAVAAARAGAGVAREDTGRLEIRGTDRARFLHGQCTQDVKGVVPPGGGAAFVLEPKGRNLGFLRFLVLPDRLLVESEPAVHARLAEHLRRFIVVDDVELVDVTADWEVLVVLGPASGPLLAALGPAGRRLPEEDAVATSRVGDVEVLLQGDRSAGTSGCRVWVPRTSAAPVLAALTAGGALPLGPRSFEILRAEAGTPGFEADIGPDLLPAETPLEHRAVSYDKGCYVGQEVVARQHFRGRPRRRLVGLLGDPGVALAPAAAVRSVEGAEFGVVTSARRSPSLDRWIALAVLKGADHADGTRVAVGPAGGAASVVTPPFVRS
jgi:folate-binding protein YgfZ